MGKRSNGEGPVVKRKDGRWCAAYTVGGKRKYLYGKTRKEVARKLRDALAEKDSGTYYPDIKLKDYLGQWLEDFVKESVRARTYERYESVYRVHIIPSWRAHGDGRSIPIKGEAGCRVKNQDGPVRPRYSLHKALKQAVRWRLVPRNVAEGATPPRVGTKEVTVLSPDQVKVFFKGIRGHRLEAMFVLAATAGPGASPPPSRRPWTGASNPNLPSVRPSTSSPRPWTGWSDGPAASQGLIAPNW